MGSSYWAERGPPRSRLARLMVPKSLPLRLLGLAFFLAALPVRAAEPSPEERALEYLSREVPLWKPENQCFSCHHNGDSARALFTALRLGRPIERAALADTVDWLLRPEDWDHNGGEGEFSNKVLAALQFAVALSAASEAGAIADRAPLMRAAERLLREQSE